MVWTVLHELGHYYHNIDGIGGSPIVPDAGTRMAWEPRMTFSSMTLASNKIVGYCLLYASAAAAQERPSQPLAVSLNRAIIDRAVLDGRRVEVGGELSRTREAIFLRTSKSCIEKEGLISGLSGCMADISLSDQASETDKEVWARLKRDLAATMRKGVDDYYVDIKIVAILDAAPIIAGPVGSKGGATRREIGFGHLSTFPIRLTVERIAKAGEIVVTPRR